MMVFWPVWMGCRKCIPCCRDPETSWTQWWYRITSLARCLLAMEKEDLGLRPNCHLLGLGMTTPHRSCVISENGQSPPCLGIGSGEQRSKEAFVSSKKAVDAGAGDLWIRAQERWVWGAHLATRCSPAAAGWGGLVRGGHGRFSGIAWSGGCSESKQAALMASGFPPPNKSEKGGVLAAISKIMEIFLSSWKHKAGKSLSSINMERFVWGQWQLKSDPNEKNMALKSTLKRVKEKIYPYGLSVLQSNSTIKSIYFLLNNICGFPRMMLRLIWV